MHKTDKPLHKLRLVFILTPISMWGDFVWIVYIT